MDQRASVWMVLVLALVLANLPYLTQRLFGVLAWPARKHLGWELLESLVYGGLTLLAGMALEGAIGQRAPQGWEFFAAFGCLFLTLGFPGFVWRHLRRPGRQWVSDGEA